ncbi:TetR/AcrR family transcriptional regulator [Saccharothrix syringae]|uniref:TetR/AcrR family transcriptional regulator n=1 Tax=Saccharothrix syringae TaxID=103733 RepID=A0A5Q0H0Z0_SACSY|nr:TetR/AcrR family transcriptional regulator [Saccharothrix syringae]QFZ19907.1 TetR/AcrR family transcriptional regulator [Saccharothrix syringae]
MARTASARADAAQRPSPVRERILAAADEHFYAEGIRTVSADRLIAEAGVSKVTFYRHFPSKDDLVLAYLAGRSALERHALEQLRARAGDACETLVAIARAVADMSCAPGFRGCPFLNAVAEYADPTHPVRQAVAAHRDWFAAFLGELLGELGIDDRTRVADQLVILRDGAMVGSYLSVDPESRFDTIVGIGRAVIDTARGSR